MARPSLPGRLLPFSLLSSLFSRKATFEHGIHPAYHKETGSLPIQRFPFAPKLFVPLSQHIGKPAVSIVRVGQEVFRGEVIATANGMFSLPIHAPATGIVEAISLIPSDTGAMETAITIRVYEADGQEIRVRNPQPLDGLTGIELALVMQQIGVAGKGGAVFPTHAKLIPPNGCVIDTLIVNGAECEPFLTCDHRIMVERAQHIMTGIDYARRVCGAPRAIIGVEDNKPDAVAALIAALPSDGTVTVKVVKTKYPQGAAETLTHALLGREVPIGKRSSSIGVVMNNVMTMAYVGKLLPLGEGMTERVVTVAGPAVERPGNYIVPLGTPLRFLLDHVGAHGSEVILGGPMMGAAISSLDIPITKGVCGVLAFGKKETASQRIYPCIHCGECIKACPKKLNPTQMGLLSAKREYDLMADKFFLDECFECGCCSYVCPSHIPLVQQFRVAKSFLKDRKKAA
ncbi:MAG: electron transport complex subunit RsxC [Proteobacteria bacterium]|nr:electron transport complex subunit RsxC [Pseudomonadota bacterium]